MIVFITLLALVLRLYQVPTIPPSLYSDEVAIGYNAYSILQTGRDEWGVRYPILFRSYNDYKPPVYIYTVALFEKFLGPTDMAVRLPSVVSGTLTVFFMYFLVKELLPSEKYKSKIALMSALLLAISPWHIQFTRAGFEASETLLFIVIGVWLFLKSIHKNIWWLLPSLLSLSLATMTYHSARIFVPIFMLILVVYYHKALLKRWRITALILIIVVLFNLPYSSTWVSQEGRARLIGESILSQPGNLITNLQQNYVANFSLDYLFFHGDQNGRHSVKKLGELYLWQLPFLLVGVYLLVKRRDKLSLILLSWLLIAPIPAAITKVSPHALRGLIMVIPLTIICALVMRRKIIWLITPVVIFQMALYLHLYYVHAPKAYAADWQDGNKQAVAYLQSVKQNYDEIFVDDSLSPMYLLFYTAYNPALLQAQNHDTTTLGIYHYANLDTAPIKTNPGKRSLIVAPPWRVGKDVKVLKEIKMLSGDPVFEIYEY